MRVDQIHHAEGIYVTPLRRHGIFRYRAADRDQWIRSHNLARRLRSVCVGKHSASRVVRSGIPRSMGLEAITPRSKV